MTIYQNKLTPILIHKDNEYFNYINIKGVPYD